ncbi:4-hydroxy-tetrahydrodipicolinate synthase [Streptomyces alkaliterrae]|uniref:4-hydroxy-tetrahydrodipicolinate synthase n=1 Tax=Streptomyces alkaliterrae TaxID=2213162 RepID=A0A5P0YWZ9_9ACTN|nr:4-hydroxy-tetrahydrodipicolinate synthase [Streptomyces alkaliterrae]MBB1260097.1 4-hydroxy-tetrahydrodipicolinate synthase [Streptomyces alkaliterrae]MQS04814.1 4-hydroxy-tetrahydrodipicolinate synthase [Streptomyces alkaliterrae]
MSSGPFGRLAAAMITPFADDGTLDLAGARRLAAHLVDRGGCDALVVNGTTGESVATSDAEKLALLRAVLAEVGDRARVTAGVGSADTRRTVELARASEDAGAHGLLVVTPYYSRPTPEMVAHHLATVADNTALPVLLYDIPERTGVGTALTPETLRRLAEHPKVAGVKDCSHDLLGAGRTIAETGLALYAGSDEEILPLRAIGAAGAVSTVAHVAGPLLREMLDAFDAGNVGTARERHQALLPLLDAMRAVPGTVAVKALYAAAGLPGGPVRGPLLPAGADVVERLVTALRRTMSG